MDCMERSAKERRLLDKLQGNAAGDVEVHTPNTDLELWHSWHQAHRQAPPQMFPPPHPQAFNLAPLPAAHLGGIPYYVQRPAPQMVNTAPVNTPLPGVDAWLQAMNSGYNPKLTQASTSWAAEANKQFKDKSAHQQQQQFQRQASFNRGGPAGSSQRQSAKHRLCADVIIID
eukprot:TRINITY_DN19576_c0_g1_i1.p1 TRINITY_DN19576_c0_g1~~TRINITY_DN19576_c0_g1_i1.p1  ORF type:complete len:172 (+),score=28.12 TRINITY_DN19576_c0_g1_i1:69-584(+)